MAVYLGSNWVGETRAIYSDTGESLTDFIDGTISGSYENSKVTSVRDYAFYSCSALTTINFPSAIIIGNSAFAYCYSLNTVSFPNVTTIRSYAFNYCSRLTTISFPKVISIGSGAFRSCYRLLSLYLLGSSIPTLASTNAFLSTPISYFSDYTSAYGSIYVPASLYSSYITATNWAIYSSRFVSV